MHMPMKGISNVTEQWCPVKGGCISEVSSSSGFTVGFCSPCKVVHTYSNTEGWRDGYVEVVVMDEMGVSESGDG